MPSDNTLRISRSEPDADFKMMNTPDLWPHGSILCLARRPARAVLDDAPLSGSADEDLGLLIVCGEVPRWTVIRLNLLDKRVNLILFDGTIPEGVVTEEYQDAGEIISAGWVVD
jgi:hypothetical protein